MQNTNAKYKCFADQNISSIHTIELNVLFVAARLDVHVDIEPDLLFLLDPVPVLRFGGGEHQEYDATKDIDTRNDVEDVPPLMTNTIGVSIEHCSNGIRHYNARDHGDKVAQPEESGTETICEVRGDRKLTARLHAVRQHGAHHQGQECETIAVGERDQSEEHCRAQRADALEDFSNLRLADSARLCEAIGGNASDKVTERHGQEDDRTIVAVLGGEDQS